jgi:hypothetical protein
MYATEALSAEESRDNRHNHAQKNEKRYAGLGECVLFIGTQFSNLYTAVDTPAGAA